MPKTTGKDVTKTLQNDLGMDNEPTRQEVPRAIYAMT